MAGFVLRCEIGSLDRVKSAATRTAAGSSSWPLRDVHCVDKTRISILPFEHFHFSFVNCTVPSKTAPPAKESVKHRTVRKLGNSTQTYRFSATSTVPTHPFCALALYCRRHVKQTKSSQLVSAGNFLSRACLRSC